jgi:hypothetical protein
VWGSPVSMFVEPRTSQPHRPEGTEAIVLRTVNDQPSSWHSILPLESGRVDVLWDNLLFAPFAVLSMLDLSSSHLVVRTPHNGTEPCLPFLRRVVIHDGEQIIPDNWVVLENVRD